MKKVTLFSISGLVLAIALITIFLNVKTESYVPAKREESQSVDVEITDTEPISETASEIEIETIKAATSTQAQADEEHEQTADTIITTEIIVSPSESWEEHGLIIGDYHEQETYNCGTLGHHCAGPETHALLMEMADKGCAYCGSHSCPSFCAVYNIGITCPNCGECVKAWTCHSYK